MTKYLGIDYGLTRTGVAVSDPDGRIAFPLAMFDLEKFKNRSLLLDELAQKALTEHVEEVVIGLPLYPDGNENLRCRQVRNFADRLAHRLKLPIHFEPETYTTLEAEHDLAEAHIRRKKFKNALDQQAACRILQSFLARRSP